jgi:hypothetical protein
MPNDGKYLVFDVVMFTLFCVFEFSGTFYFLKKETQQNATTFKEAALNFTGNFACSYILNLFGKRGYNTFNLKTSTSCSRGYDALKQEKKQIHIVLIYLCPGVSHLNK